MLKLFKRKSKVEVLQKKYEKLMAEAHKLSTVNRTLSDEKIAQADAIAREIDAIRNAGKIK